MAEMIKDVIKTLDGDPELREKYRREQADLDRRQAMDAHRIWRDNLSKQFAAWDKKLAKSK